MPDDGIIVASLSGAFGVHGEVRLKSFCAVPEDVADFGPFQGSDGISYAQMVLTGQTKGGFTARVDGITTKEEADARKGVTLSVPRDQLPSLPDDEFYHADLIDLLVVDTGGAEVGRIKAVQTNGADDLLEVILPGASDTALIPFTRAIVPTVDLTAGRVVIDPPPGLLPGDEE